jgi:hypothetical protein
VALAAGDIHRMHAVLTLLQSMPVTGQLLYASQVAKPVRGILQQQMQLQTQHMRQQGQGLLEEVVGAARLLRRRWKALLAAEVEACDEYRTSKAQQVREMLHWAVRLQGGLRGFLRSSCERKRTHMTSTGRCRSSSSQ